DPVDVLVEGEAQLRKLAKAEGVVAYLSPRMLDLLGRAEGEAARGGGVPVDVMHLLVAASQDTAGPAASVLRACGLSGPVLRATAAGETLQPATIPGSNGQSGAARPAGGGKGNPLEQYGRDLTQL